MTSTSHRFRNTVAVLQGSLDHLNDALIVGRIASEHIADEHAARSELIRLCAEILRRSKTVDDELPITRWPGQS